MGNGGYEVDHYDLNLSVRPKPDRVKAVATLGATATQALSSFNLDFRGLKVTSVTVDGTPAAVARRGGEMTVRPTATLASGARFTVRVAYKGRPRPIGGIGWIRTHDGTTVFSEPNGSPGWFPCNDHPTDKASYSFTVTVPRRYRAIANGLLDSVQRHRGATTFAWHEPEPMATYLATVTIGHFRIKSSASTVCRPGRPSPRARVAAPGAAGACCLASSASSRTGSAPIRSPARDRSSSRERGRRLSRPRRDRSISALPSPRSSLMRPGTSGSATPFR